ncbi:MAG: M20/M25/M40 family metallo-hydrolase [Caulobacteraceae bacterium]
MKATVIAMALLAIAGRADAAPDSKLLAAVQACAPGARTLEEKVVGIDSGSADREGVNAVGAVFAGELKALGASVKSVPSAPGGPWGDNVVATLTGSGKGRILLIAHMDTVFSKGDVARLKPHWQGDTYFGPGAGDDKAGGVTALCALKALTATGYKDFARIDVLLNATEEIASPGSKDLIAALAKQVDLVINLERGVPSDRMMIARKGNATLTFEFAGRAAHSGLEPEKGRNAALEAARVALAVGSLADSAKETTVTVDILQGGDKTNVVPDKAVLKADVRAFSNAEFDRVEAAAAAIAAKPGIEGVTIRSSLARGFPPWPRLPAAEAMLARANRRDAERGRKLDAVAVGSSSDASLAAATGTPTLDGFGMEGDGAHSVDDQAHFDTLTPRAYLLARMLMDVGHDPKGR